MTKSPNTILRRSGTPNQKIVESPLVPEMEKSYIEYAMSVIVGRALPDVRDGLKPVHRRILYAMYEDGLTVDKPFKKSATCVGDVLGRYHPHGDASVYDALVRLAQDFSMRYPLVDGHGNFGSVDGDPPAAYRYTEARMSRLSDEMLRDIEKDTVDWDPNFDETRKEPRVLPSRFPNLLVNGSSGIAVGMATNIPPHNLREVIGACICVLDNPEAQLSDLMQYVKGPDFPTRGIIMGRSGIRQAYATGRGRVVIRARHEFEEFGKDRTRIVITEIPYQVNKRMLIKSMADQVEDKRLDGISDIRDESDRNGMRIVIELKRDANPQVVLNRLFAQTQLQTSFAINMLALVNNQSQPKILSLRHIIDEYLAFQEEVIIRRTKYDLRKAQERAHLLEGLLVAQDNIDEVIKIIRSSYDNAKENLMSRFGLDDVQAQAILDMRLKALQGLDREKLEAEYKELEEKIAYFNQLLSCRRAAAQGAEGGAPGHLRQVRRRPGHGDPGCGGRDRHRGPDRGGAVRLHPDPGGLHQADTCQRVHRPVQGRHGQEGHHHPGGGLRGGRVYRLHPRLYPLLHRHRQGLPEEGLSDPRVRQGRQGHQHRQHPSGGAGRADPEP